MLNSEEMMSKADPAYLFADVYDSVEQSSNLARRDKQDVQSYLGRLRLDAFLYRRTVLTDAQLLDGTFFLAAAEGRIFNELPFDRFEIRSRAKRLDEALLGLVLNPRGIWFSSLPKDQADRIQRGLIEHPSPNISDWRKLGKILVDVGLDQAEADRLENAWAKWIEKAETGQLIVRQWDTNFHFTDELEKKLNINKDRIETSLTEFGKRIFLLVWKNRSSRNAVYGVLWEAYGVCSAEERVDLATIESWFNSAYNNTAAQQHSCGTVEVTDPPGGRPINENQLLFDRVQLGFTGQELFEVPSELIVHLPIPFVQALGSLPAADFMRLTGKHINNGNLDAWYDLNDINGISNLRRAVYDLVEQTDKEAKFVDPNPLLGRLVPQLKVVVNLTGRVPGVIAGVALGAQSGGIQGAMLGAVAGLFIGGLGGHNLEQAATPLIDKLDKKQRVARSIVERAQSLREQGKE